MSKEMIKFINDSPTAFNAISNIKDILNKKGYVELLESNDYSIHYP